MTNPVFSVVVPVFNSEHTLAELFQRTKQVFADLNESFEVIFVEDGGSDQSWEVLDKIRKENSGCVTAIKLSKNFGQHNATFCGMAHAAGDFIITIDDDLQIPPEEIIKLVNAYRKSEPDLVYGYFPEKKHSFIRNLASEFIKTSSKKLLNAPGEGSSFKLMTKDLVKKILGHSQEFVFIDELLLWYTGDIEFVRVDHMKRSDRKSSYSASKLIKLFLNLVIYYTAIPLRIMIFTGLVTSIGAFAFALYRIYRFMYFRVPLGYTSVIVTILITSGILLLSMGILGEYIHRIYKVQNRKPPYSIKKILR